MIEYAYLNTRIACFAGRLFSTEQWQTFIEEPIDQFPLGQSQ